MIALLRYSIGEASLSLARGWRASLLAIAIIAAAVFIAGAVLLVSINVDRILERLAATAELTIYLKPGEGDERRAAVAGFVATAMLVPSKEEQALKKLAAVEKALNPPPPRRHDPDDVGSVDGKRGAQDYKSGRSGMLTAIMGEVIGAIKPAVISLLTSGVTASAVKPTQAEMQAAAAQEDANAGAAPAEGAQA